MPRNSSGVYALPSGNPVQPDTLIETGWANPTMSDLGSELTNSLDRQGRGTMLAPLKIFDGTVVTPGLSFNAESSTGLYRASAHVLGIAVAGIAMALFTDTNVSFAKDVVAQQALTVAGATTLNGANTFNGATTVAGPLTASGAVTLNGAVNLVGASTIALALGTALLPSLSFNGDPNTGMYSTGADQVAFATAGLQRLVVGPNGGWTIPVASPAAADALTINAAPAKFGVSILGTAGSAARIALTDTAVRTWSIGTAVGDFFALRDETRAVNPLVVNNVGMVSIAPAAGGGSSLSVGSSVGITADGGAFTVYHRGRASDNISAQVFQANNGATEYLRWVVQPDSSWQVSKTTGTVQQLYLSGAGELVIGSIALRPNTTALLQLNGDILMGAPNRAIAGNIYFDGAWKYAAGGGAGVLKFGDAGTGASVSILAAPTNAGGAGAAAAPFEALRIAKTGEATFFQNLYVGSLGGDFGVSWRGLFRQDNNNAATVVGIINNTTATGSLAKIALITGSPNSVFGLTLIDGAGAGTVSYDAGAGIVGQRFTFNGAEVAKFNASNGLTVTTTSGFPLSLNDPTTGPNILMFGNGAVAPRKYIRVNSGNFEIINNDYTRSLLLLTEAGVLSVGASPPVNDNTLKVPTTAYLQANTVGSGIRSWQSFTSPARQFAVAYNAPAYPIEVVVRGTFTANGQAIKLTVGGIVVCNVSNGTAGALSATVNAIVPAGVAYRADITGAVTQEAWSELL